MPPSRRTNAQPNDLRPARISLNPDWNQPSGGRHHIFLFDGTWNDETGIDPQEFTWDRARALWVSRTDPQKAYPPLVTNVVKTWRALGPDGENQITHYLRGVGNDDENDAGSQVVEGALSHEEASIRYDAYCRLLGSYRQGDVISILGFSRGAASARLFARDLASLGIVGSVGVRQRMAPVRNSRSLRREIWRFFPDTKAVHIRGEDLPISFLGVWDTVATSMSASAKDWEVPASVLRTLHCVALDEIRRSFAPTLMPQTNKARIREVWFAGGHCDVGGSYLNDALARITLGFMLDAWDAALVREKLRSIQWNASIRAAATDTNGQVFVRHQELGLTAKLGVEARDCIVLGGGLPQVHSSLVDFTQNSALFFGKEEGPSFPPKSSLVSEIYQPENLPESGAYIPTSRISWT